jgi:predicted  nucleic acid-binding Zn-ribbon protein
LLLNAQEELNKRIGIEKERGEQAADLQQRLAETELNLSKMKHEYMSQVRDLRRKYEKSFDRLRKEIDNLDKQRRTILRERTGILQKIFKRPENRLAESANNLQLKKNTLGDSKEDLKKELGKLRKEYENKRKQISAEQGDLRQKLTESRGNGLDDAVELRRSICQKLRDAVAEAVDRLPKESDEPSAQE